jgi:putative holliday junction resolvase
LEQTAPSHPGVYIGIDPGTVRCGVAAADATGVLASPVGSVPTEPRAELPLRIQALLGGRAVGAIVIGLALDERGGEAALAQLSRSIASQLAQAWGVEIISVDERFSSREAQQRWQEVHVAASRSEKRRAGKVPGRKKQEQLKSTGQLDALAATAILQGYLDGKQRPESG